MKPFLKRLVIGSSITAILSSVLCAPLRMWMSIGPPIFVITFVVLTLVLNRSISLAGHQKRVKQAWPPGRQNFACLVTGALVIATLWVYTLTVPRLFPEQQQRYHSWVLEQPK
jgi:4-hydroxybenzoate polyprenyltransferase